jgi:hypothetical protein
MDLVGQKAMGFCLVIFLAPCSNYTQLNLIQFTGEDKVTLTEVLVSDNPNNSYLFEHPPVMYKYMPQPG